MPATKSARSYSLDQIDTDYEGQWVIVRVTAWAPDPYNVPSEGQLLAHGSRAEIDKLLGTKIPPGATRENPYYVFRATKPIRSPEERRALLARAVIEEPPFGGW
jgi:hypothetical protein